MKAFVYLSLVICGLSACTPPTIEEQAYQSPQDAGLIAVRPYPAADDVCQVIGENDLTREYLGDASLLIGCPAIEVDAIATQKDAGATVMDQIGAWTLLSVPLR